MATKADLTNLLSSTPITVSSKAAGRFVVRFFDANWKIPTRAVDRYLHVKPAIQVEPDTVVYWPGHYERFVEMRGMAPISRLFARGGEGPIKLSNQDKSVSIELSTPSLEYILAILGKVSFSQIRRRLPGIAFRAETSRENGAIPEFASAFQRMFTIKVAADEGSNAYEDKNLLAEMAEAAVFHFSYGTGAALILPTGWERAYYRLAQRRREAVQFPRRIYNFDLVSYYELALASDSLVLGFLALYKILEHFFSSASERVLHDAMVERLVAPDFSHTKATQLRQLTAAIRRHDQKMDERKMLTTVIEHYFKPDDISDWVAKYERDLGKYYTVPQTVFAELFTLDLNPDGYASSLAKRIYHIRNVVVHNKEGESSRFIPFSGQENVLFQELPIVLFMAEQLIIKSGKDIE